MEKEKLCPLNKMNPCIGKECALYMPAVAIGREGTNHIEIDVEDMLVGRCAIAVGAASNLLQYAANTLDADISHSEKLKDTLAG